MKVSVCNRCGNIIESQETVLDVKFGSFNSPTEELIAGHLCLSCSNQFELFMRNMEILLVSDPNPKVALGFNRRPTS